MESDEDTEESVRKITEFIDKQKTNYEINFQEEFEHFVAFQDEDEYSSGEEISIKDEEEEKETTSELSDSNIFLSQEEKNIIDSCPDPQLKELLLLNRQKNIQTLKVYRKFNALLKHTEETIERKKKIIEELKLQPKAKKPNLWKLAAPYFKTQKLYQCPPNEDTIIKRNAGELSYYEKNQPSIKWSPVECERLINAVKVNYRLTKVKEYKKQFHQLRFNDEEEGSSENTANFKLEPDVEEFEKQIKLPPVGCDEGIDWERISSAYLNNKRPAEECRSMWHLLLHPSINKSPWDDDENKKLLSLVQQYNCQNWEAITADLNTNRSPFMVCVHYFRELRTKFKGKFTEEEDKLLLELVEKFKMGQIIPWPRIVMHFQEANNRERTRVQLYHRYYYYLQPRNNTKVGKFSQAEDILILILMHKFGRNFQQCSLYMPHRTRVQLKNRFGSNLRHSLVKGTFTVEEDEMIMNHVAELGPKQWNPLATKMHRYGAQVRQRYRSITNYLQKHPGATIASIPRTRQRVNDDDFAFLTYMADQYKDLNFIPTLAMIEEALQVEMEERESEDNKSKNKVKNIDALLTEFFSSTIKMKTEKSISAGNFYGAAENLNQILQLLNVQLTLPEDLENENGLDHVDVEILKQFSKNKAAARSSNNINKLMAPNLSNLVALRGLIINHKTYKQEKALRGEGSSTIIWRMEQNLLRLDEDSRSEILRHRQMFSDRFDVLFDWGAILSLIKPNLGKDEVANEQQDVSNKKESPVCKKRKIDESVSEQQIDLDAERADLEKLNFLLQSTSKMDTEPSKEVEEQEEDALQQDVKLLDQILNKAKRENQSWHKPQSP